MKKLLAWSKQNPVLAVLGIGAIITAIVFAIKAIVDGTNNNSNDESHPNSTVGERAGSYWLPPITATVIGSGGRPSGGIGAGNMGGAGGGMGGGVRVNHGKS